VHVDQTLDAERLYLTLEGKQTAHNLITCVVFWGHRRLEHPERGEAVLFGVE